MEASHLESLDLNLLISVIEFAGERDVLNLRLVCKQLRSAVELSAIQLFPPSGITSRQLAALGRAFPHAKGMSLAGCSELVSGSLVPLSSFFPKLR